MEYIFRKVETGLWIKGSDGRVYRRQKLHEMIRGLPTTELRQHIIKLLKTNGSTFQSVEENAAIREFKKFTDPELFWTWAYGDLFLLEESKYPLLIVSSPPEHKPADEMDSLTWFRSKMQ